MWFFYMLPIAWLFQNTVHEVSHLFFALRRHNRTPLGLWPYPHRYNGRFYFARCAWDGGPIEGKRDIVWVAPLVGAALVGVLAALAVLAQPQSVANGALAFTVCAMIDAIWWFRGYLWGSRSSDGKRWRYGDERG